MENKFQCRARRYFKDSQYEIWSLELDYGEGYIASDKLILEWDNKDIKALWLIQSSDRMESEYYTSVILALFEDIIEDDGDFLLEREQVNDVMEYDIQDLKKKHNVTFHHA